MESETYRGRHYVDYVLVLCRCGHNATFHVEPGPVGVSGKGVAAAERYAVRACQECECAAWEPQP